MPSLPFNYSDFRGGYNTKDAPYLLTDNEARDVLNVQATQAGAIVKRAGLVTFATCPSGLNSLAGIESTASPFLIGAGSGNIVSTSAAGTVTTLASGLSSARWEFVQAPANGSQGPVWGMNGVDDPIAWDGVSGSTTAWTATSGSVPNGKYCLVHQNQVFVSGVAAHPSRVYWSGLEEGVGALPRDWDENALNGAGFTDLDPDDGQAITALGTVGPYVLIAKPRKIWILYDVANTAVRVLSTNVGVISHRSLAQGPEGVYFLAEDRGVYLTDGSKIQPISDKIQPTVDLIAHGARSIAAGAYFAGHYYLSVSFGTAASSSGGGTTTPSTFGGDGTFAGDGTFGDDTAASGTVTAGDNDTTLDYDATLGSWWKHSIASDQFAVWHPQGVAQLYSAKSDGRPIVDLCFQPGVTVDNGNTFTWRWAGPWQSPSFYRRRRFPTPYFRKRLRQVRFDGSGSVDFSLAKDFQEVETLITQDVLASASSSTSVFGGDGTFGVEGVFGSAPTITRQRVFSLGVADAFSVVLSGTSTTPDLVTSYTMYMIDRRDQQT